MATTKTRRPGSGRTKGSYSFVTISITDLLAKFNDQTTPVIVSRKWAEQVGFKNIESRKANETVSRIDGRLPDSKVETKIRDFNTEE
jgi:hypothetical protein